MHDLSEGEILASELFMELASELRCSILMSVSRKPAKVSTLARELDSSVQDVHRNVNRLTDIGLVKRENVEIHLTEYGRLVTNRLTCGAQCVIYGDIRKRILLFMLFWFWKETENNV